jgi:hypothetical protein
MRRRFRSNQERKAESKKKKILDIVSKGSQPVSIDAVAHMAHVHWLTAKAILMELVAERKITGFKTSKSWVFVRLGILSACALDSSIDQSRHDMTTLESGTAHSDGGD